MSKVIVQRNDVTAEGVRRFVKHAKHAAQARQLSAIAAILAGASCAEAAHTGGMDRQTMRDWAIRFNEHGPDGLINVGSPGASPKLDERPSAFLTWMLETETKQTNNRFISTAVSCRRPCDGAMV